MESLSIFYTNKAKIARHGLIVAVILIGMAATVPTAAADSYVQGMYVETCLVASSVLCSTPPNLFGIPQAPSANYDNYYHGSAAYQFEPYNFTTVDTHLAFSLNPGSFHAIGETAASLTMGFVHGLPQTIAFGDVRLIADAKDTLRFSSGTLASGTLVTYQLTAILDSTLTGNCDASTDSPAGAWAALSISGIVQPGDLFHSTCGVGSNHMTVTKTLTSSVGGISELFFNFQMRSTSGIGGPAAFVQSKHTVDAMNSGEVYINVLTPGVTFASDSGNTYTADVPEPSSLATLAAGGLMLVACAKRKLVDRSRG